MTREQKIKLGMEILNQIDPWEYVKEDKAIRIADIALNKIKEIGLDDLADLMEEWFNTKENRNAN